MESKKDRIYRGILEVIAKAKFKNVDPENPNLEKVYQDNRKETTIKERYFIEEEIRYLNLIDRQTLDPEENGEREQYDLYLEFLQAKQERLKNHKDQNLKQENDLHPHFDPNLWNKECFELFKYLFDNYYYHHSKKTKRKLTNIWFYLKFDKPEKYTFLATKDQYKQFIEDHYKERLTNMDKPDNYDSKQLTSIDGHRILYEESLNSL